MQSEDQARSVMSALRKGDVDGVISLRSLSLNIPGLLLETATRAPMPAMFHIPFFVERGSLASYSASERELGGQAPAW